MKRKYNGIIAVVIAAAAVGAVAAYAGSGLWRSNEEVRRHGPSALSNIKVPSQSQMAQMEKLKDHLAQLASPVKRKTVERPLVLFGYRGPDRTSRGEDQSDGEGIDHRRLQLSLTLQAGLNNYCILDGKFMAEGAHLADGTAVLKIESHRVLVALNQERRWIYLQEPQSGTADPANQKIVNQGKRQS